MKSLGDKMSLFQCDNCGCLENTALTFCGSKQMQFFVEKENIAKYKQQLGLKDDELFGNYCSACCPLGNGEWHGELDRIYLPKKMFETASNGNLRHKETLEEDIEKYILRREKYI